MRNVAALLIFAVAFTISLLSCKAVAKTAFKYWSKRQVKEFVANCEEKTGRLLGDEKAKKYCDCAVDVVAEKYRNYEDLKSLSIPEVLKIANDCK